MTRDDIIRMARESELWLVIDQHYCEYGYGLPTLDCYPELERFAALIASQEREACAKMCDDLVADGMRGTPEWNSGVLNCAEAIRARGENP